MIHVNNHHIRQVWTGDNVQMSNKDVTFSNKNYNGMQSSGTVLELGIQYSYPNTEDSPTLTSVKMNGINVCSGGGGGATTTSPAPGSTIAPPATTVAPPATTTIPGSSSGCTAPDANYDYDEVLHKSLLFYEAQRSGALPSGNRIPYRGDSAMGDAKDGYTGAQIDLTGGYYDGSANGYYCYELSKHYLVKE